MRPIGPPGGLKGWLARAGPTAIGSRTTRPASTDRSPLHSSAVALHLDHLLEGGPVDPRRERLGDGAERTEQDRVEARLVALTAVLAAGVVLVELARRYRQRLGER